MKISPSRLAAIVLNYRGAQDTLTCLESLLASEEPPQLLIVVDNNSGDDSLQKLRTWGERQARFAEFEASGVHNAAAQAALCLPEGASADEGAVLLIRSPGNRGYAAGNNLGLAAALALGADACWVLNNDTHVDRKAPGAMRERLQGEWRGKRPGLVGSLILYDDGAGLTQCCAGGYTHVWTGLSRLAGGGLPLEQAQKLPPFQVEAGLNFIYGASVLASREFLQRVGFMDEGFFLYCEEQDWAWRGLTQGFGLAYAPDAFVYHKEGASTGMNNRRRAGKRLLQLTRSRLLLAWKHQPLACGTVLIGSAFAFLRILWRGVFRKSA